MGIAHLDFVEALHVLLNESVVDGLLHEHMRTHAADLALVSRMGLPLSRLSMVVSHSALTSTASTTRFRMRALSLDDVFFQVQSPSKRRTRKGNFRRERGAGTSDTVGECVKTHCPSKGRSLTFALVVAEYGLRFSLANC